MTTGDRDTLRTSFDSAAALYQYTRPEYPAALVDELVAITGHGEIRRRLAERPDGMLRRHWGSVLQVARRLGAPRRPTGSAPGD
jgi:hypothetical protein